jgi:hypothetical protein
VSGEIEEKRRRKEKHRSECFESPFESDLESRWREVGCLISSSDMVAANVKREQEKADQKAEPYKDLRDNRVEKERC